MFVATAIVSALLALAAIGSAMGKLTKQPKIIESLSGLGVPMSWLPRLAAAEIAGGVGLLIGLKLAPLGIAAAVGLIAYFAGAIATHVKAKDNNVAPPLVLMLISVAALVLRIASS
jgi:uncharacterized membrane protein YphA (DoxX/SURF4 family)